MSKQKKCSIGSVIGGILCMIFIPVIVINLTLIISTYTKPGEMPGVFGVKPAIVLSGSMEPEILTGDMIFLHKTDPDLLQTGDVICYLDSGQAITHRIVAVREGEDGQVRYITQGDGNNTADRKAVRADQVQGIWRGGKITGLGNGIMFMQSTTGTVSYTHLDVYKRQAQRGCCPGRAVAGTDGRVQDILCQCSDRGRGR